MRTLRCTLAATVLALGLSTSGAFAGIGEPPRPAAWSLFQLGDSLWSSLAKFWAKVGCHIDPSGRCEPQPSTSDIGCNIDPNGHCAPQPVQAKTGCNIDPNGHCAPQPVQTREGCHIDPDGRCSR